MVSWGFNGVDPKATGRPSYHPSVLLNLWYLSKGEPQPAEGVLDLDDETPGLGIEISEDHFGDFDIIDLS